VHRDVSPQNILVGHDGAVKVIDFGVLKARGRLAEETLAGVVKGKLHYVAPERALGGKVDCRADVWAMGAILYRILGGRPVYDGEGNLAIVRQLMGKNQVRPLPRSVPRALRHIVYKALECDPEKRYGSMAELRRELEAQLHQFALATTTEDVARFVASVLGPSLAERRAAIYRAVERQDETATLRLPNQAHIALVPPLAQSTTSADVPRRPSPDTRRDQDSSAKPALKLIRNPEPAEIRLKSVLATTQRRRRSPAPRTSRSELARLFAGSALVVGIGLLVATLHSTPGVEPSAPRPLSVAASFAQLPASPLARAQDSVASPQSPIVVNLSDLPIERALSRQSTRKTGAPASDHNYPGFGRTRK
ncbi:MAG TPA: serine/threonine-protein kinase, partial [Polyangiaceae bacterium]